MTPSRDLVLGLAAALGFGGADFMARQVTQRIGFLSTLFFLQTLGAIGLLPLASSMSARCGTPPVRGC